MRVAPAHPLWGSLVSVKRGGSHLFLNYALMSLHNHPYDPEIHHRKSPGLPAYNYSSTGAYFVTICLQGSQPYLEDPQLRHILEETWDTLPQRFPRTAVGFRSL